MRVPLLRAGFAAILVASAIFIPKTEASAAPSPAPAPTAVVSSSGCDA